MYKKSLNTTIETFILFILFFLSGLSALIYESAWSQQLSLIFGSTELAIAAVLASYMAGLALGAKLISMVINRIDKPIKIYAIIEILIAITALSIPFLLEMVSKLYSLVYTTDYMSSSSVQHVIMYVLGSFVVLLIPTSLMGATLPLLAKFLVSSKDNLGNKIGLLYSVNTLGACAGALSSAFVLLPLLGLGQTIYVAVAINAVICIVGIYYFRNKTTHQKISDINSDKVFKNQWILAVMFVSGAVSLAYEILWTRLLNHILGGSVYSFGVMLFVFLLAIAVGAFIGSKICKSFSSIKSFVWIQLGIAVSFSLSFHYANLLPEIPLKLDYGSLSFVYESLLIGLLTLFPGALFIGATFPLAIDIVANNKQFSGVVSARVYSWNTLGAILGSLLLGFYVLPTYGFAISSQLLSSVSVLLSIFILVIAMRNMKVLLLAFMCLVLIWAVPQHNPYQLLKFSVLSQRQQIGSVDFLGIGESATVMLIDQKGEMRLLTNGLPESAIQINGSRQGKFFLAHWLSMLPVLAHPQAKDMLIIGLGAGITLKAVPPSIEKIDVVELEQQVIEANKNKSSWRGTDPLSDPRLKIHNNDARNALRNSNQDFDIIVSQPSHPWTAGSSSLYSQEFFNLVKSRLRSKGVFVQWIGMGFVDPSLLNTLMATLNSEFGYVELFQPLSKGGLVFVSSNKPIQFGLDNFELVSNFDVWYDLGIGNIEQLLLSRRIDAAGSKMISAHAPISTDYFNVLKLRSPKIIKSSLNKLKLNKMMDAYDPLINQIDDKTFSIIRRLMLEKDYNRAIRLSRHIKDGNTRDVVQAIINDSKNSLMKKSNHSRQYLISLLSRLQQENTGLYNNEIEEIMYYLIGQNLKQIRNGKMGAILQQAIDNNAQAQKLLYAARLHQLKKWQDLKSLESFFTSIAIDSPAHQMAEKYRLIWRFQSNNRSELIKALQLIDHQLVLDTNIGLLLMRAQVGIKLVDYNTAIASMYELLLTGKRNNNINRRLNIILPRLLGKIRKLAEQKDQLSESLNKELLNLQKLL